MLDIYILLYIMHNTTIGSSGRQCSGDLTDYRFIQYRVTLRDFLFSYVKLIRKREKTMGHPVWSYGVCGTINLTVHKFYMSW